MRYMRAARAGLFVAAAIILGGCGDSRVRKLTAGISRDSALTIMGGKPERVDAYIIQGRLLEALYYSKPGADSGTTPERKLVPVVVDSGKVIAWGWGDWEPIARGYNIQIKQ